MMRETSRSYHRPYRPFGIRVLNRTLAQRKLSSEDLVRQAEKVTRESVSEDLRQRVEQLVCCIETEAHLHRVGRTITRSRLLHLLVTRLRLDARFRREPSLLSKPMAAPIVIAGLQRTGTTLLHRLLASDPRFRALLAWEALNPLPPAWSWDHRRGQAHLSAAALRYLAPDFFAIHPIEVDAPEEEVLLLDLSFLSPTADATLRMPSYAQWLLRQDHRPAYELLGRVLRTMPAHSSQRWVLKTPYHLSFLDDLLAVFPGAKIIQTHRDPITTLASFCSMIAHGRGVFSDAIDTQAIGQEWLTKVATMLDRSLACRERYGKETFVDIPYEELVDNPLRTMKDLYEQLGMAFTEHTSRRVQVHLRQHHQHRFGRHRYDLADFGLRRHELERKFSTYRERFISRPSRTAPQGQETNQP